jgi:site-specific DNA-methyltransferase (adenine-specific)
LLYRDKLPKFNNKGNMVFNCFDWPNDDTIKVHPTQKPIPLLERLIEVFTDAGDVVIDPVAGSGTTLKAAKNMQRRAYGFEFEKSFYNEAITKIIPGSNHDLFTEYVKKKEYITRELSDSLTL